MPQDSKYFTVEDLIPLNLLNKNNYADWVKDAHQAIDSIEIIAENIFASYDKKQFISSTAKVHPTAIIGDYVYIGDNVIIGPYSYIKSYSFLLPGVKIGFSVEVDRCILFNNTKAAHHSCIGRCIVGENSNLAFGFVMATRNILGKPIQCHLGSVGQTIKSNRQHHGAVIGANLKTGVNVSVMPGATLLDNITLFPNCTAKGFIKSGSLYK